MKQLPYTEGTWFAVPDRSGTFAVGVVARTTTKGKVILTYLFNRRSSSLPTIEQCVGLRSEEAALVLRIGDLGLVQGEWPIIGQGRDWNGADWPMPKFIRRDVLSNRAWLVTYADEDPNEVVAEEPWNTADTTIGRDSLYGAGAVEIALSHLP